MPLDETVLLQAREARDRLIRFEHEAELARVSYQHAIRRLHAAGASLREIADALDCSFCGRSHPEVDRLIAGPNVAICDPWDLAQEALDTGSQRVEGPARL